MPKEYRQSQRYQVQPGDSLWAIATRHDVTLDALLAANAGLINDPNVIQAGWELIIPGELAHEEAAPPGSATLEEYTVTPGDTLSTIALRWGTTVAAIAELNGIPNPDAIAGGQRLKRPGSVQPGNDEGAGPSPSPSAGSRERRLEFARYPLDMPPSVITGGFREDYGGYLHRGIDLGGVAVGTPIFAPAAGRVTVHRPGDGWGSGGFGICLVLDHPGTPWWSIYAHMSRVNGVTTGDSVDAGDVIGFVGFTGTVVPPGPGGAHLHWQLSAHPDFPIDFQYIANPLDFLVQP
jgi:murein DD-endopeptidase MepM/ murein hydrolase activator NlpD